MKEEKRNIKKLLQIMKEFGIKKAGIQLGRPALMYCISITND